jgi:hypothetical protein
MLSACQNAARSIVVRTD